MKAKAATAARDTTALVGDMVATSLVGLKIDPDEEGEAEAPPVGTGLLTTEAEATGKMLIGTSR